jgi:hypothetical protein
MNTDVLKSKKDSAKRPIRSFVAEKDVLIAAACALAICIGVLYILSEILNTLRKIKDAVEHTDFLATCEEASKRVEGGK